MKEVERHPLLAIWHLVWVLPIFLAKILYCSLLAISYGWREGLRAWLSDLENS